MTDKSVPCLQIGARLQLRRADGGSAGQWEIKGLVGRGGSAVCYSAGRGNKTGRLKEFLPVDVPVFCRGADGLLVATSPKAESLRREFLRSYETLEQYKRRETGAELLNNFLPPYELLYGGDSVYVWTPDDKQGVSFEYYLQQAWKAPQRSPEHKLYNILQTVLTMTDCVRVFHRAGLLHLDIKPDNFLVLYDGQFNISPSHISVFDISTLSPADGAFRVLAGTDGYFAPEVPKGRADNRSDIYSIGAMLFRAITNPASSYRKEQYPLLDRLVAESDLIEASQTNANVFLRHVLGRILKKCLAFRPADRYSCCEELMADLEQAITFLLPDVAGKKLGLHKRLAVLDTEPQTGCDPTAVIHDLLFRHPLDKNRQPGEPLRVLVLGAGTYGQKFIDICLQAGQLPGCQLQITALSQQPELDREVYLQIRPALTEFVDCDGIFTGVQPYARLEFLPMAFQQDTTAAQLQAFLSQHRPNYVFISLGDDRRNRETARIVAQCCIRENVYYVVSAQGTEKVRFAEPVHIRKAVTAKTIHPLLQQMAFYTHLSWMDAPQPDLATAKRQFRKKYNYHASLSYALSVPGKLRSLGISPEDPRIAAREFSRRVSADSKELQSLAELEHRRWVLEKVTAGWQPEQDLPACIARGAMRDDLRRTHPCLLHSTRAMPLQSFSRFQWDTPGAWDEDLDPLDRLSVTQHRLCLSAAEKLRNTRPLQTGEVALIGRRLEQAPAPVKAAFEEYRLCLQGILQGSFQAAQMLDRQETALRKTFAMLTNARRKELCNRLEQVRLDFFPAAEVCQYRDYKALDALLVLRIPHILCPQEPGYEMLGLQKLCPEPVGTAAQLSYMPSPPDTDSILLTPQLLTLTEQLAENIHDIWASQRLRQGWTYGESRDDTALTHPCLVPYNQLPEQEKAYDRSTAMQTLKIITALGYKILPPEE